MSGSWALWKAPASLGATVLAITALVVTLGIGNAEGSSQGIHRRLTAATSLTVLFLVATASCLGQRKP
jgi:hypothetical protein